MLKVNASEVHIKAEFRFIQHYSLICGSTVMQDLNWQCKSRHFRNVCPNNQFFKLINKPSTQEKPLISTARIQNMHICTVQCVHPCFDKIATILAKRHQKEPRDPYKCNIHHMNY